MDDIRVTYEDIIKELKLAKDEHIGDQLDYVEVQDLAVILNLSPNQLARQLRIKEIPIKLMKSPRSNRQCNFVHKNDALKIIKER